MIGYVSTHLPRGGDGGQCASMEGVDRGDDDGEVDVEFGVGVLPRELDGSLVGLCSTVAEKGLDNRRRKVGEDGQEER